MKTDLENDGDSHDAGDDYDEVPGTTGPTTCPIDPKSPCMGLPNQSSESFGDVNPKYDQMQKMIDARVATKFDETGGMKGDTKPDRGWAR